MGPIILFIHLKIILLQCFQFSIFNFQFLVTINSFQTDLYISNLYLDWNDVHHDMTQLLDVFLRTRLIDIFFETVPFNF